MSYVDANGFDNMGKANFVCCNGCEKRSEGCHDRCPSYIANVLNREEERKEFNERSSNNIHAYFHKAHRKEAGIKKSNYARVRKSRRKNK